MKLEGSRDFLRSNRKDCEIYVCHVPFEREIGPSLSYMRTLNTRLWFLTISADLIPREGLRKQVKIGVGNLEFRIRRVRHADVGGATSMEFWVCSGVNGESIYFGAPGSVKNHQTFGSSVIFSFGFVAESGRGGSRERKSFCSRITESRRVFSLRELQHRQNYTRWFWNCASWNWKQT